MVVYDYLDYKEYVRERVASMPHRGHGQFRQMALLLDVSSTVMSQIFSGDRHLTPEQGLKLADFFGFSAAENRFFINLILKDRAGTKDLENYFTKELKAMRAEAKELKAQVVPHKEVSDEHKGIFYSNWYYSGVRMLSAIPGYDNVDTIADHLGLTRGHTKQIVDFLLQTGLCVEKAGKLNVGPPSTHIDPRSPLLNNHRRNWRMKAVEKLNRPEDRDLFYSGPMSLSREDKQIIRDELIAAIARVSKRVEKSPEEEVACLNVDWFSF